MERTAVTPTASRVRMARLRDRDRTRPKGIRGGSGSGSTPGQDRSASTYVAIPGLQRRIEEVESLERELEKRPKLPDSIDTLGELGRRHADIHQWHEAQWRSLLPEQSDDASEEVTNE